MQPSRVVGRLPGRRVASRIGEQFDVGLLRALSRPVLVVLLGSALACLTLAYALRGLEAPLRTDYLAMLTGARVLVGGGCLYCQGTQAQAQAALLGAPHASFDAFLETPLVALAYRPLLALPPAAGYAVFLAASGLCVDVAATMAWGRLGLEGRGPAGVALVALTFLSLPAAWNYRLGQVDALLVLPLVGGALLLTTGRRLSAGLLLSLPLLKPQTEWLVPVALLAAAEWRALAGMAAGVTAWAGTSLWIAGPGGVGQFFGLLGSQGPPVATSVGVPGVAASVGGSGAGFVTAMALGLLACGWLARRRPALRERPLLALSIGVATSLALAPHVYSYDLVAAALPLVVMARRRLGLALGCALLLDATHLVDTLLVVAGPHLEAVALVVVVVALASELSQGLGADPVKPGLPQLAGRSRSTTSGA